MKSSMRPGTLTAAEFIQRIETEKNVAAVEYATKNPTSPLHQLGNVNGLIGHRKHRPI